MVTLSPKINNGLASLIFLKPSGSSDRLSKKGGFLTYVELSSYQTVLIPVKNPLLVVHGIVSLKSQLLIILSSTSIISDTWPISPTWYEVRVESIVNPATPAYITKNTAGLPFTVA